MLIPYFAYGSNMCTRRLAKRVNNPARIGQAKLIGYDFRFHKKSKDCSAKANAYKTGCQEDVVWGVLFEFDESQKCCLDKAEAVGQGYNCCHVEVEDEEGNTRCAFTYLADEAYIVDEQKPYFWYKRFITEGAEQHGLPDSYIEQIKRMPGKSDPCKSRREKEGKVKC